MSEPAYRLMIGGSPVVEVHEFRSSVIDGQPLIYLTYEVDGLEYDTATPVASTELVFKRVAA